MTLCLGASYRQVYSHPHPCEHGWLEPMGRGGTIVHADILLLGWTLFHVDMLCVYPSPWPVVYLVQAHSPLGRWGWLGGVFACAVCPIVVNSQLSVQVFSVKLLAYSMQQTSWEFVYIVRLETNNEPKINQQRRVRFAAQKGQSMK